MYLRSTIYAQSLELSTTTMVSWYKNEDNEGYLNNITRHNLDLIISILQEVFHNVESRMKSTFERKKSYQFFSSLLKNMGLDLTRIHSQKSNCETSFFVFTSFMSIENLTINHFSKKNNTLKLYIGARSQAQKGEEKSKIVLVKS